jgi:hypothetical protein
MRTAGLVIAGLLVLGGLLSVAVVRDDVAGLRAGER